MIKDVETFVNSLNDAVNNRDRKSRKRFLNVAFKMLKENTNVPDSITLQFLDHKQEDRYNGFLHIDGNNESIFISDQYVQTDDKNANILNITTLVDEYNNYWLYPIEILECLAHELKHCEDYYNNKIFVLDRDKIKEFDDELKMDLYMNNSSEISAFKYSYITIKKILSEVYGYCVLHDGDYDKLLTCLMDKMLPWATEKLDRLNKRVALAKERLSKLDFNVDDYYITASKSKEDDLRL